MSGVRGGCINELDCLIVGEWRFGWAFSCIMFRVWSAFVRGLQHIAVFLLLLCICSNGALLSLSRFAMSYFDVIRCVIVSAIGKYIFVRDNRRRSIIYLRVSYVSSPQLRQFHALL